MNCELALMYTCPFATTACDRAFKRCDEPPHNSTTGDCGCFGPRDRPCEDCCFCLSPFGLALDIVTLVPRCLHFTCMACSQNCKRSPNSAVREASI